MKVPRRTKCGFLTVETWYDKASRSWITQVKDSEGNPLSDAEITGNRTSAYSMHDSFVKDNTPPIVNLAPDLRLEIIETRVSIASLFQVAKRVRAYAKATGLPPKMIREVIEESLAMGYGIPLGAITTSPKSFVKYKPDASPNEIAQNRTLYSLLSTLTHIACPKSEVVANEIDSCIALGKTWPQIVSASRAK